LQLTNIIIIIIKSCLSLYKLIGLTNIINPLNAELNPICQLLAVLGAHHILHFSKIRVNFLTAEA